MVGFSILLVVCYLFSPTFGSPIHDGEDVGTVQQMGKKVTVSGQTDFPFIVKIDVNWQSGITECGGVIISRRLVLTAAHCIAGKVLPIITIRAGIVDLVHEKDIAQKRIVVDHHIHEQYRQKCLVGSKRCCHADNDIALLWTAKYFEFGPKIKRASFSSKEKPIGKTGWILGWGLRSNGESPSMLQKGLVKVTTEQTCEKLNPTIYISQNVICLTAVSEGTSTGLGDSGGPFVIDGVVYGLASYTFFDQCHTKSLEVFTYIGKYYSWIKNNLDAGPPKDRAKRPPSTINESPTKRRKLH